MFVRPGMLSDYHPRPYANTAEARISNYGAVPPDLSLIVKARARREDYVFSLLVGYTEPPAGLYLGISEFYNPYFPGGKIAMAPPLVNEMIDYNNGTSASLSQMAKDVSEFLCWTSEPEHDDRKKLGFKVLLFLTVFSIPTLYWKRLKWAVIKHRKIEFR